MMCLVLGYRFYLKDFILGVEAFKILYFSMVLVCLVNLLCFEEDEVFRLEG